MKRILLSLFLCCFTALGIDAQNESSLASISQSISSVFDSLRTDLIPSGYLKDKAVDLVKLSNYTGVVLTDSNYVDPPLFKDLIRTMNYAAVSSTTPQYDPNAVYSSLTSPNSVKLCSALFKYEFIVNNALQDGLIRYDTTTGKAYNVKINNVWQNPYNSAYAFMFVCGCTSYNNNTVTFDLSGLNAYGNCSVTSVMIDFGQGYSAINGPSQTVTYTTDGQKELKMKVVLSSGIEIESHTFIIIQSGSTSYSGSLSNTSPSEIETITVDGLSISATCSIKYHYSHGTTIVKPFIYVEGFDHPVLAELTKLSEKPAWEVYNNILNETCSDNYSFNVIYDSVESILSASEYDFIYVNWNNPEADIRENAQLLQEVIRLVNSKKPIDGSGEQSVMVAHSMGGLITRWALRQMELNDELHHVGWFVSQDVPYLGAVVPIGVQYTIRDIYSCLFGGAGTGGVCCTADIKTVIDKIVGILDCTSARQMMYYYVGPEGNVDSSYHSAWQTLLDSIGFPEGDSGHPIENLAIASGGDLGVELSQSIVSATAALTDYPTLANKFSFTNLGVSLFIDRDRGNGNVVSRSTITYTHLSSIPAPSLFFLLNKEHTSSSSLDHYDLVMGSYLGADSVPNFVIPLPQLLISLLGNTKVVFIPTASALVMNNYYIDYYLYPPLFSANYPFTSYCLEEDAMRHDNSIAAYINWIIKQASASISGPDGLVLNGDSFNITGGNFSYSNQSWSTSDFTVAHFSNEDTLTVSGCGVVDIIGSSSSIVQLQYGSVSHNQKRFYRKRKTVLAGFPNMVLSNPQEIDMTHTRVYASCVDTMFNSILDSLAAQGIISYEWGYGQTNGGIQWAEETDSRSYIFQGGLNIVYYMRILNGAGRQSSPIHTPAPPFAETLAYGFSPNMILVSDDDVFLYYNVIQDPGYGTTAENSYAATWINTGYEQSTIPDNLYIDGQSLPVITTTQQSIGGQTKTLYCFNLLNSTKIQSGISAIRSGTAPPIGYIVRGYLRNGTTNLQQIIITMTEL